MVIEKFEQSLVGGGERFSPIERNKCVSKKSQTRRSILRDRRVQVNIRKQKAVREECKKKKNV